MGLFLNGPGSKAVMEKKSKAIVEQQFLKRTRPVLEKTAYSLQSPQGAYVQLNRRTVLNLSSHNYLGLANDPMVVHAAKEGLKDRGYGLASATTGTVTLDLHKNLENTITAFLQTEESLIVASVVETYTGLFQAFLGEEDAVLSDTLNPPSIMDGIRLCEAKHYRYRHKDMSDLECVLKMTADCRLRLIVTCGVFPMDGQLAPLAEICRLADQYDAIVLVDDAHGIGVLGERGRGSGESCGVSSRIDLVTGALGMAMGGTPGGFISGQKGLINGLRQSSYTGFESSPLPPMVAAGAIKAFELAESSDVLRNTLLNHTAFFRQGLTRMGYIIKPGTHPIIPVLIDDEKQARQLSLLLFESGIYAEAVVFPLVPEGDMGLRVQISALHTEEDLSFALDQFKSVGQTIGLLFPEE